MSKKIKQQESRAPELSQKSYKDSLQTLQIEDERKSDPLTQWKISSLDNVALKKWKEYSLARDDAGT